MARAWNAQQLLAGIAAMNPFPDGSKSATCRIIQCGTYRQLSIVCLDVSGPSCGDDQISNV